MEIELGWMNLTPCAKVEWRPFPQLPVVKTGEQRLYGYVNFDSPNWRSDAEQAVKDCAIASFGIAGGMAAISGNPGAFVAAFGPAFLTCIGTKAAGLAIDNIRVDTRSVCLW